MANQESLSGNHRTKRPLSPEIRLREAQEIDSLGACGPQGSGGVSTPLSTKRETAPAGRASRHGWAWNARTRPGRWVMLRHRHARPGMLEPGSAPRKDARLTTEDHGNPEHLDPSSALGTDPDVEHHPGPPNQAEVGACREARHRTSRQGQGSPLGACLGQGRPGSNKQRRTMGNRMQGLRTSRSITFIDGSVTSPGVRTEVVANGHHGAVLDGTIPQPGHGAQ